ncbi:MAG: sulfatase-like hydrolase/transferase [Planctomycetota bacterium]
MKDHTKLFALLVALWIAPDAVSEPPPNIIHIMVDDAGLGDFTSFWADSPIHTPNLDQLAAGGMKFTQAYAGGANCAPSRSALMTGRHLGRAYMRSNAGSIAIRNVDTTIAEVLGTAGYATAGYGKWGLGAPGSPGAPERQGFDEFVGYYDQVHAHSHYPDRLYDSGQTLLIPENANFSEPETGLVSNSRVHAHSIIFDRMKTWVQTQSQAGTPFYAWGAWTPPHRKSTLSLSEADPGGYYELYASNPGWDDFDKIQAAFVTWVDEQVGELRATLQDPNGDGDASDSVAENTLIVFTSDNGGWENGNHAWDRNIETVDGQSVDLRRAKESYYEGGLRTPMIAYWPGTIAPGTESDLPVAFYDYLPTFAELAGVQSAVPDAVDGVSFAPTVSGVGSQPQRDGLYFEGYGYNPNREPTKIARIGDWKMIANRSGDIELYNLAEDPSETTNRAFDASAAGIREQLLGYIQQQHTPIQTHLSILPANIGTGNAGRDGIMPFGVRGADKERVWFIGESGDTQSLSGPVRGDGAGLIDVYLDDLHMVWSVDLTAEVVAAGVSQVEVRLIGDSGFSYFEGSFDATQLPDATASPVTVSLTQTGVSPEASDLAGDLGGSLRLEFSHSGPAGALLAGAITVTGVEATITVQSLLGDLSGDGLIDTVDWLLFRTHLFSDLSALSPQEAAARGDLDGDGQNDERDFALFKSFYNAANGAGSFRRLSASVPEPTASAVMGASGAAWAYGARRRVRNYR